MKKYTKPQADIVDIKNESLITASNKGGLETGKFNDIGTNGTNSVQLD